MKKNIFYTLVALVAVGLSSCKDFLDVNTNPNAPTVTVPDLVLSGALTTTAYIVSTDLPNYAAYWAGQYGASGTYSAAGDTRRNFNLTNTSFSAVWTDNYSNLVNYDYVLKQTSALKNHDYYAAIAIIMKVHDYQILVDNYGDIPYSQSLKGFSVVTPKYDDAQTIYTDLSKKLDSAVAIIQNAAAPVAVPKTTDIMFGGDMDKWVQFANTLNLRILIHQSNVSGQSGYIASEIAGLKAPAGKSKFLDDDALVNPGYTKAAGLQSPWWEFAGLGVGNDVNGRDYHRASQYAVNYFKNTLDPRIALNFRHPGTLPGDSTAILTDGMTHADSAFALSYVGIPFGANPDNVWSTSQTSGHGIGVLKSPAMSVPIISAAESFFLQAEAAFRGGSYAIPGGLSVKDAFDAGVTASFDYLGLGDATESKATAYLGTSFADFSTLAGIIQQKWAASFDVSPMEAWTDLRRTGYPNNLPQSLNDAKKNPTPPIRLLYPQGEYNNNAGAVQAAVDKQKIGDQFDTPIFWEQ